MTTWLKFIHLATIALWSGGLFVMPLLFLQRANMPAGVALDQLQRFTRQLYVGITSPAAFIAIASGTALIFLQSTFTEWFSLKMLLVAIMAVLHVVSGLVLGRIFESSRPMFGRAAYLALSTAYFTVAVSIIWIVLAKPDIDSNQFATRLFSPGGLRQVLEETRTPIP